MELAAGSLMDLLDAYENEYGTEIPADLACHYLAQAAKAIDFLNAQRHNYDGRRVAFQHCDIKPNNLLISGDTIKVADFGLATPLSAGLEPHGRSGTLDFAAPEIFRGQVSDRTDQYALAVSYYLLRTGRLPFRDTPKSFTPTYNRGQPDLSLLPQVERPIVGRALAISPIHRWPNCGALMGQLQDALHVKIA
jgi:serine/threonine protein kinase